VIAAVVREYPADYEVALWVFVAVAGLLFLAGAALAWGRRGGDRRG
jgi:hypothetical protein